MRTQRIWGSDPRDDQRKSQRTTDEKATIVCPTKILHKDIYDDLLYILETKKRAQGVFPVN